MYLPKIKASNSARQNPLTSSATTIDLGPTELTHNYHRDLVCLTEPAHFIGDSNSSQPDRTRTIHRDLVPADRLDQFANEHLAGGGSRRSDIRVLDSGGGLARLVWEIANRGLTAQETKSDFVLDLSCLLRSIK
ncbi:hypothetical protein PTTG_30081 [Puccinia triticina 1-1 BBBD Race 1]|uniref:Uncharacterized protein n=1 Tax=Puccinia triticina (isolate 1-1 / race 1 (BBBD)) TaxID=630390 RepID=A0A180G088_PUCT1|nr:hypothetical protein PTTG_30081 [Puccinia triticina 1-1 BBBD Race 1]